MPIFNSIAKSIIATTMGILSLSASSCNYAQQDLISLFPLNNYDQTVSNWIKPSNADFDKPLLNANIQQKHFDLFYDHYFGSRSPWNPAYVTQFLQQPAPNNLKTVEQGVITDFNNTGKSENEIGYGENFRPYTTNWIETISNNINLPQFDNLTYQANNRGIAIDNLHARVLPTDDVHFYSYKLAGQGYPFDNLQMSALWAGTPVYIIAETQDHAWMLVLSPDFISWVKSNGIARVNDNFVNTWTTTAKKKLVAITQTNTSIVDENKKFLFSSYVGAVFPANNTILVPSADENHFAVIKNASLSSDNYVTMPLQATPHHFANLMTTLIGRPYGWGGMYFYNDCSAELKSLFTPFGIWLPRHSSDQVTVGNMVDMTSATADKRLAYLKENGQRFLTLVYIGGHIILYIGNYSMKDSSIAAMTYQNIWGLSPKPADRRAVIGQAVLFPMLLQYPEDTTLASLADKKYFQVSYLNQLSTNLIKQNGIDIKSFVYPDQWFTITLSPEFRTQ